MPFPTNLPTDNNNGVAVVRALNAVYDAIVAGSGAGGATAANQVTYGDLAHADAQDIEAYIQTTNDTLDTANGYLGNLVTNMGYEDSTSVTAWLKQLTVLLAKDPTSSKTIAQLLFNVGYGASAADLIYQVFAACYGIHNDTSTYLPYLPDLGDLKKDNGTSVDGVNFDTVASANTGAVKTDLQTWASTNNTKRIIQISQVIDSLGAVLTTIKYRS